MFKIAFIDDEGCVVPEMEYPVKGVVMTSIMQQSSIAWGEFFLYVTLKRA